MHILTTGLLFAISTPWALGLALVNVMIAPIYAQIEDARLIAIFGEPYRAYQASVGGFLPKLTFSLPGPADRVTR